MHTSPLSKEFYNSISDVLMGKTTTKLVLPASLVDSANKARKELKQSFLSEGFVSIEARRDILRKNLKEGADTCGCTLTAQMVSRFSEMAGEAVAEEVVAEEVVAEEVVAEEVETADTDTITDAITEADHIIEVTNTLTDFVKELNVDEVRILKNLLNNH